MANVTTAQDVCVYIAWVCGSSAVQGGKCHGRWIAITAATAVLASIGMLQFSSMHAAFVIFLAEFN